MMSEAESKAICLRHIQDGAPLTTCHDTQFVVTGELIPASVKTWICTGRRLAAATGSSRDSEPSTTNDTVRLRSLVLA